MDNDALSDSLFGQYLRYRRNVGLAGQGLGKFQEHIVETLATMASKLLSGKTKISGQVKRADATWETTWLSVEALLESWTEERLWALIDREGMRFSRRRKTPHVVGHFIASTTPHLAWTSVARALLVGASSVVRLPTGSHAVEAWSYEFLRHLKREDPGLEEFVGFFRGGRKPDALMTREVFQYSDTVLVYGSDETIETLWKLAEPGKTFVGYGHRVSFGFVMEGSNYQTAADGSALDIAILDQQGCLSPQTIFVEGPYERACEFGKALATSLAARGRYFSRRESHVAAKIHEQTALARFEPNAIIFSAPDLRWTVVVSPSCEPMHESVPGLVYVKPFLGNSVNKVLNGLQGKVQGASVSTQNEDTYDRTAAELETLGVSYVCKPGRLQRPPFEWREDGWNVLRSLL